jgi:putative FmdB family regulatory protein
MPFYEYECANCKFYKEVMQKISDAPLKKCPSCGKNALKKLVSAPVFRLKGAGWYETDFKSDKENKRNLVDKEPEPEKKEAVAATDAKADAKPAEKGAEGKADAKPVAAKADGKAAAESKPAAQTRDSGRSTRSARKSAPKAAPKKSAKKPASRKRR